MKLANTLAEYCEVKRLDDDDLAEVHNADGASEDEIQEEIDACPGECIHWKD